MVVGGWWAEVVFGVGWGWGGVVVRGWWAGGGGGWGVGVGCVVGGLWREVANRAGLEVKRHGMPSGREVAAQ